MLRTVEHRGIQLSSVGIGTWAIGGPYWTDGDPTGWSGPIDDEGSVAGLLVALDNGLSHIDTADVYGHGRSERLVRRALRGSPRTRVVASKVGFVPTSAPSVYSRENIEFQCEQSLRNLNIDVIDIYYLHHCNFGKGDMYLDEAVETVQRLRTTGKIRSVGLSGYSANDLIRVSKKLCPDFIQSWASIEHPEFILDDGPLAPFMKDNGIKFVAMMPFGQGRLLAKHKASNEPVFGPGDTRSGNPEFKADSLAEIEPRLKALQERFGPRPSDLIAPALGFVLSHEVVASVIPGFRNPQQVSEICDATQQRFTADDRAFIERIFPYSSSKPHPWQE